MASNNIGYSTYYLGIPKNIKECLSIYLYRQSGTTREPITLYNISDIFKKIKSGEWDNYLATDGTTSPPHLESERSSTDDYFELSPTSTDPLEFDTIIYISSSGQSAVGFTSFSSLQTSESSYGDLINTLKIQLNFTVEKDHIIDIEIINTLSELYNTTDGKDLIGSEDWEYTSISELKNYIENESDNYNRYTSKISSLISDKSYNLLTDTSIFLGGDSPLGYRFFIGNNIKLNYYNTTYTKFLIGNYKGDLVLYEWNSNYDYKVVSLTDINTFSIPREYFTGTISNTSGYSLIYMAYSFAVFSDSNGYKYLYSLENKEWREVTNDFYIDPWDPSGKIVYFNRDSNLLNLSSNDDFYKSLRGIVLDISENKDLMLHRKIGSWYIFKAGDNLVYSNENGTVYFGKSDKVLVINDRCLLSLTITTRVIGSIIAKERFYNFHFVDSGSIIKSDAYYKDNKLSGNNTENYKNGYIHKISSVNGAKNQPLIDGLRRNPLSSINLPGSNVDLNDGIISSYCGILFYVDNTKTNLRYL